MDNWIIIEELVQSNWLIKQCFYITKNIDVAKFYESEVILKLYNLKKLQELYKNNEHKQYINTMVFNIITDKRKKNHYNYEEYINYIDIEDYIKINDNNNED